MMALIGSPGVPSSQICGFESEMKSTRDEEEISLNSGQMKPCGVGTKLIATGEVGVTMQEPVSMFYLQ